MGLYRSMGSLRRPPHPEDDVDPMSSVANISDAMLVFACGLLISLVVAWNIDIASVEQVEIDDTEALDDVETLQDMLQSGGDSYVQRGTVYQDPRTGRLYMVETGSADGADGEDG